MASAKISSIIHVVTKQTEEMSTAFETLNGIELALTQEIGNQSVSVF